MGALYRVRGQGLYREEVLLTDKSLRKGLTNFACKLRHLLVHVRTWLLSWSCGHVATGCDVVLLCRPWWHYIHDGGSLAILCNTLSVVAFVIVFLVSKGVVPRVGSHPRSLIAWLLCGAEGHGPDHRGYGFQPVWMAAVLRSSSWIPSRSGWDRTYVLLVHIWTVGAVPITTVVRCCLVDVAWLRVSI
jgi:hypothetical protein